MYKRHTTLDQITAALTLALAESFEDNAPWRTIQAYVAKRDGKRYDKRDKEAIYALFPSTPGFTSYQREMSGGYQIVIKTSKPDDRGHWQYTERTVYLIESRAARTFDLAYFCQANAHMLGECDERNAARKAVAAHEIAALALKIWRLREAVISLDRTDGGLSSLIDAGTIVDDSIGDVIYAMPGSLRTR